MWRLPVTGLWWRLRRSTGVAAWCALLLWIVFAFRVGTIPTVRSAALLDDGAFLLLALWLGIRMEAWPRMARLAATSIAGGALIIFSACNTLYFAFFGALVNLDAWQLLAQAPDASTSIAELITRQVVAIHIVMPLLLFVVVMLGASHARPRHVTRWSAVLLLLACVAQGAHARLTGEAFLLDEHNGVMLVARQAVERLYQLHGEDAAAHSRRIVDTLAETYPQPPETAWRTGFDVGHPLLREPLKPTEHPDKQLNVVLVLMESVRAWETGIGRDGADVLMPNLDKLARQGLHFPRFYANGYQTVRGELSTLCSVLPNFGHGQIYTSRQDIALACIPNILEAQGYQTHWISAYASSYGNKLAFLSRHGIQHFHDKDEISTRRLMKPNVGWGASDEDLADFAVDTLDAAKAPFFAEVMTLSNHHPFTHDYGVDPPAFVKQSTERALYTGYLKGVNYTDVAIGRFMEKARKRPWFKDTLFIFLGDHGAWMFPERGGHPLSPAEKIEVYHRSPLVIYSPAHVAPSVDNTLGSQIDIAPTLLDMLGVRAPNAFEGTSLLQPVPHEQRTVVMGNDSAWNVRQGDRYCMVLGQSCFKDLHPFCPDGFKPRTRGFACFEDTQDLLEMTTSGRASRMLDERESALLVARGRRHVENNTFLLMHDAFIPH